jgi:AhpD family alkylhydroperoxidase
METMMTNRTNPYAVPGNPVGPFNEFALAREGKGPIERSVIELVKIRASQINGCAMCLNMHTRDARKAGETEARIYLLAAWRDSPLYNERERAAIGWTEALTLMDHRAMDDAYEQVAAQFTPEEQVQLNLAIGIINVYNRLNAGFAVKHPVAAEDRRAA